MSSNRNRHQKPSRTCCKSSGLLDLFEAIAPRHLVARRPVRSASSPKADPFQAIVPSRLAAAARHREDGMYAASDTAALLQVTRRIVYLEGWRSRRTAARQYRVVLSTATVERRLHIRIVMRSSSANTATTCRRKSSSSRGRYWPTPWR